MDAHRSAHAMQSLREKSAIVLPSLLQCDFGNLEREIHQLEDAGVQALHLDVMDGHFVPNFTYGMPIVAGVRRLTELPVDVHLMMSQPWRFVQQFVDAGADSLTIHAEISAESMAASEDVDAAAETLQKIRAAGVGVGLALNPSTELSSVEHLLPLCDLLLIMSVDAGFGGQKFNPVALDKLRTMHERSLPNLLLEVDGGVSLDTISDCHSAGATLFVVGSAIFASKNYRQAISQLMQAVGCS